MEKCMRVDKVPGNRDRKIDLYRGIAAIGVISIHTAFWSGEGYVPQWFQSVTLLVDVPYFFFIAGKSARFHVGQVFHAFRSLCRLWIKWIFAVSVLAVVCLFFKGALQMRGICSGTTVFMYLLKCCRLSAVRSGLCLIIL